MEPHLNVFVGSGLIKCNNHAVRQQGEMIRFPRGNVHLSHHTFGARINNSDRSPAAICRVHRGGAEVGKVHQVPGFVRDNVCGSYPIRDELFERAADFIKHLNPGVLAVLALS